VKETIALLFGVVPAMIVGSLLIALVEFLLDWFMARKR